MERLLFFGKDRAYSDFANLVAEAGAEASALVPFFAQQAFWPLQAFLVSPLQALPEAGAVSVLLTVVAFASVEADALFEEQQALLAEALLLAQQAFFSPLQDLPASVLLTVVAFASVAVADLEQVDFDFGQVCALAATAIMQTATKEKRSFFIVVE